MTPEQKTRLMEKSWLARAKLLRPFIARRVAAALNKDASQICFSDLRLTNELSDLFAQQVDACESVEARDRTTALEMVVSKLGQLPNAMFLLPSGFDDCGMVSIEVADLVGHLDDLVLSQYEALQLMSPDGKAGVSLITQEAALPLRPRFVKIWHGSGQNPSRMKT